jgi:hypothetical protein
MRTAERAHPRRRRTRAGLAIAALLVCVPQAAMGDGDPASDFLLSQPVFVPYSAPSPQLRATLFALAEAAKRAGCQTRVAVIQRKVDLGAIPQLLGKPKTYARFLGAELRFAYRGQLLVVMEQGYGLTRNGAPVPGADRTLAGIPPPAGNSPDQLTTAAIGALRHVCAASGFRLPTNAELARASAGSGGASVSTFTSFLSRNRTLLLAGVIVLCGLVAAGSLLIAAGGSDRPRRGADE